MTDRIMLRAHANESTIDIRTVCARMKTAQRFLICYEEFDRLRDEGHIISSDIRSFVKIRLDEKHDRIAFDFTWLTGHGFGRVEGTEQAVDIRWSKFRNFLDACRQPDGPKDFKAISLEPRRDRPRLVFSGSKANLRAAVADRHIRHKDVPSDYQAAVKKCMDRGALKGTGGGEINVSEDFCRTMTVLDRLGKLD